MADSTLRRRMAWTALLRVFKPGTPGLGKRLSALPRMVRATVKGEYDGGTRLALLAASAVYIISPIDAVPELFLLVLGVVDDLAMATYFAGALLDELERFLEWEKQRDNVIPGHVVK
ncbi:YkvA family protein [Dactylosporangium sp. NPDC005555]|uniref:YkvA family protein n=1 Tax=Dactylosporangium sp. NPDC005555 TaxID=3154889 RepID=UPI0033AAA90D